MNGGRVWAYIGTLMGVSVSAGANWIETVGNPDVPKAFVLIAAGFMGLLPVGLFVSLEVLVRNRIKEHLGWWRAGMMLAATAFAVPSYSHMHDLLVSWGQNEAISYLTPLGWDAVMLLSTLALLLPPAVAVAPKKKVPVDHWWTGRWKFGRPAPAVAEQEKVETLPPPPPPPPVGGPPNPVKQKRTKIGADPLYAEFVARSKTSRPMTVQDLASADGKGLDSARAKLNRWRKTI